MNFSDRFARKVIEKQNPSVLVWTLSLNIYRTQSKERHLMNIHVLSRLPPTVS